MSTEILQLRVWLENTLQNSIPANDNSLRLEALLRPCLGVANDETGTDEQGDVWIVGDTPAGAFASFSENDIAIRKMDTWYAWAPVEGLRLVVNDVRKVFDSSGGWIDDPSIGGGGAVDSVNGQTGAVSLALDDLSDVDASAPTTTYVLTWNGSAWAPAAPSAGTVTSIGLSFDASLADILNASGSPVTSSGTITASGVDAGSDMLLFWDDSAGKITHLSLGTNLSITGTTLNAAGGGGGGSPGGSDTQVQYNDGGSFGGDSAFTFDDTAKALFCNRIDFAKGTDIARAATTSIGAATGNFVHLTGTTTITSFGTGTAGQIRYIRFAGAGTLTHNATSLILPGAANITTATNDSCIAISEGGSNWRVVAYTKANGQAVVQGAATVANWTTAISTASPNSATPVASWAATNAATNVDAAFVAKGSGATLAQVPTATLAGGDKRGIYATDLQKIRGASHQVASGQYSVLMGGERNAVQGQHAVVAGGYSNSANQQKGFVGAGQSNAAGDHSGVVCGSGNSAVGGQYGFIGGGGGNVVDEAYGWIPGGDYATTRGRKCVGAWAGGNFGAVGDAQHAVGVLRRSTSDATQTELSLDGASPTWYNRWVLPNNSSYLVRGQVVARQDSTGDTAMWEFVACIKRGASAAATAMVVACTPASLAADSGAATWAVAIDADTTNGSLRFRVTGQAAKSIKWVADILSSTEVVG